MNGIVKIHTPTTIGIYGPTQCGKTRFVINLLKECNSLFTKKADEIYYCYESYQECYDELNSVSKQDISQVCFHQGMPEVEECRQWAFMKSHVIIVMDDLMTDLTKHPDMVKFATVDCHHRNITMILLMHNIFPPRLRTVSLNIHYVVLFKNKRDSLQVQTLCRRVMGDRANYFYQCFKHAVQKQFGYLLVDMHPHSNDVYQLRSRILPSEAPTIVYSPLK